MSSTTMRRVRRKVEPAKPTISILDAMEDDQLFGTHFHDTESWEAWKAFLASLFGLPMDEDQLCIFRECTNRQQPPEGGTTEAHLVCGRRGGKILHTSDHRSIPCRVHGLETVSCPWGTRDYHANRG